MTRPVEVIVARSAGTCFGVDAAIEMAEHQEKPILGPLVHNPQVIGRLADQGIPILERYAELDSLKDVDSVIITAHGYPKELKAELVERGISYDDATCPVLLRWVYTKIEGFEAEGYQVILIGNPNHAEIIASRSYGTQIQVVYNEEHVAALPDKEPEKVVALCQTTLTETKFLGLVGLIRSTKYPGLRAVDTRCKPVKNQQEAVLKLAQWVDVMLIVGGLNSSNTTNLARLSRRFLPQATHHIDSPELIERSWFDRALHVGIGAGTSTPANQIEAVKQRVAELVEAPVKFLKDTRTGNLEPEDADPGVEV
jgi:4-hydroxy-3-methylbut-2-enyl diphosphate reductase